jgi:hypothetical protein
MNRIAIAFSTCDRTELTKRSIEPLLRPDKFDLHWIDGSKTPEGMSLELGYQGRYHSGWGGIRGGSGPAIVYALTRLLQDTIYPNDDPKWKATTRYKYDYIALVENDVLLDPDWFEPTMALFEVGKQDGLMVGAVSARCYEDRILIQRDGYAVCHNLGAGMIVFTREAAELVLQNYRTTWTTENRLVFSQLSGIDIGAFWAFRGEQQFLVADWGFDKVLASHGLASLALTPNRVTMLDQDIGPLGLKYADGKFAMNPNIFETYRSNLERVRNGELKSGIHHPFFFDGSGYTIFAHQVPQLGGTYSGDWRIRDFLPYGPFVWKCGADTPGGETGPPHPKLSVSILGPCDFVVSGGITGGRIRIEDEQSGYVAEPFLPAEGTGNFMQISVPGAANYRNIRLTALNPGVCFFAIKTREPQPWLPHVRFTYDTLPPP